MNKNQIIFTIILTDERHKTEIEKKFILFIFFSLVNNCISENIKKMLNKFVLKII